jgi:hypothetical protein
MTSTNVWRRSTFCETGACLEVRNMTGLVGIRDSKTGALMFVKPAEFAAFVAGAKAGEFDDVAASND